MALNATIKTATIFFILVLLISVTFVRNRVWETKLSLWADAARKSPLKSRAHNNLGNCYMLLNMPFSAIQEYQKAISLDSRNIEAYYNLGINFEQVGILNQAIYYYNIFCNSAPLLYGQQKQESCESANKLSQRIKH